MIYRPVDRLNPPMVLMLEDDQWWDGVVQVQELRDGTWCVNVVYRREGQHLGWFPPDRVRPDVTDYSQGHWHGPIVALLASCAADAEC